MDRTSMAFPFRINEVGQVARMSGSENIRAKILELVLTSPGERVSLPEFGCGLRDLVFDPNNDVLAATAEFAITKALQQWMGDDIVVERVDIKNEEAELQIVVVYVRRDQLERGRIKIVF